MSPDSPPFDASTASDVTAFSLAIDAVIAKHVGTVSANIMYVIMHFHAKQMMDNIVAEATKRADSRTNRDREIDDMIREDMKRNGELSE